VTTPRTGARPPGAAPITAKRASAPLVRDVYRWLDAVYREEHWHWYPDHVHDPLEVIIGAVLVQHTAWRNAERALDALREAGGLDPAALAAMPDERIAAFIRVSGTHNVKARRLRAVARMIVAAGGTVAFLRLPRAVMRAQLRATPGIGDETADAILLYAGRHPVFMIDAYTRRIFARLGAGPGLNAPYAAWQAFFEHSLPGLDMETAQRYHAYLVIHGKTVCRPKPRCAACVLAPACPVGQDSARPGSDHED